jgi:hypothetical protein
MNYLSFLYNEIKSFIIEFHDLYHSNKWDDFDDDDDTPRASLHSYYTMNTFFDIMGSYSDNEIQKVNVDIFEYLYKQTTTFFTNIYYILCINPFDDLDYDDNQDSKESNNNDVVIKKYDDKYDDKYNKLDTIELDELGLNMLSNKYVMEYTPVGNVLMYFDYEKRAFQYYSDFSIPYKYLECVSKKFCIVNKNKIYREIKMDVDVNDFSIIRNSSSSLQNKSKSFAKLKGYNNSNPSIKNDTAKQRELKIIQKDIVRYTHLGKLCNFSFIKNTIPKFKPVSYKDFVKNNPSEGWVVY